MRLALALLVATACASAAAAQPSEDRYGPRRAEPVRVLASNSAAATYQGRMLTWSSRAFIPQAPEAPPAVPVAQPPAVAPAPVTLRPAPVARSVAASPPAQSPVRVPVQAQVQALPDSLYAPPPPAAPAQRMAAVATPATPGAIGSPPRLYSVHRQYGMSPDAIPATPRGANYVLIAPREGVGRDEAEKSRDDDDRPF